MNEEKIINLQNLINLIRLYILKGNIDCALFELGSVYRILLDINDEIKHGNEEPEEDEEEINRAIISTRNKQIETINKKIDFLKNIIDRYINDMEKTD
jgi:hypothetical protein